MKPIFYLLFLISLSFVSCKLAYVPSPPNMPLLQEKHEVRAGIGINDANVAYAVSKNIGLVATGFWARNVEGNNSLLTERGKHFMLEGGVGYFREIDKNFIAECYSGLGLGRFNYFEKAADEDKNLNSTMTKFYIQPDIGFKGRIFEAAFGLKFSTVSYGTLNTNYTNEELVSANFYQLDRQNWYFMEPTVTLRVGYKWIKYYQQIGMSRCLNKTFINNSTAIATAGISVNIAEWYKK